MREMFSHPASVTALREPQDEVAKLLMAPWAVTCSIPSGIIAGIRMINPAQSTCWLEGMQEAVPAVNVAGKQGGEWLGNAGQVWEGGSAVPGWRGECEGCVNGVSMWAGLSCSLQSSSTSSSCVLSTGRMWSCQRGSRGAVEML